MFVSTEEIIKQYICRFSADIENDEEIKQDNHVKQELKKNHFTNYLRGCCQSNFISKLPQALNYYEKASNPTLAKFNLAICT